MSENKAEDKKLFMDTIAVNYIIAQSDGFQVGYARALSDFTEFIIDYWKGSDDDVQQSVLDVLVDLGVELGKRKHVVKKNIDKAKEMGYEQKAWTLKNPNEPPFETLVKVFIQPEQEDEE